jgi:hypothetical protein
MNTTNVLAWLQIISAIAISVSQAVGAFHGHGVDTTGTATAAGLVLSAANHIRHGKDEDKQV